MQPIEVHYIVPYFNVPQEWFQECIDSLSALATRNQDKCFFVHVVDDSSHVPLKFPNEGATFPDNLFPSLTRHDRNRGLSEARNTGLRKVDNPRAYVNFLDSDDLALDLPDLSTRCDLAITSCLFFKGEIGAELSRIRSHSGDQLGADSTSFLRSRDLILTLLIKNRFPVSAWFVRREFIGNLTFDASLTSCEDWSFWIRLLLQSQESRDVVASYSEVIESTAIRKSRNSMSTNVKRMFVNRSRLFECLQPIKLPFPGKVFCLCQRAVGLNVAEKQSAKNRFRSIAYGLFTLSTLPFLARSIQRDAAELAILTIYSALFRTFTLSLLERRYLRRARFSY